jgi:hypothetical protein
MDKLKLKETIKEAQQYLGFLERGIKMERALQDGDTQVVDTLLEDLKGFISTLVKLTNEP